jgi:parallel beta-helix repeat protein
MRSRLRPSLRSASVSALLAALATFVSSSAAAAGGAVGCDRLADPSGNDAAAGTPAAPFRTVQRLVDALAPGQTGCLAAATFVENVKVEAAGRQDAPITLKSAPGGRATLRGRLWVADSAADVVVSDLALDGRNDSTLPSPTVNGDRITFLRDDVTNHHTGICFVIGDSNGQWGLAHDTVIQETRIHDCGRVPATNQDHGIYVEGSRNAKIVDNYIYDNADRGVQLYPDAQNTLISRNIIDGNGEGIIFSGAYGLTSSGNAVTYNVISNSRIRYNVESWYPAGNPVGVGNTVEHNCLWNGKQGNIANQIGFSARANVIADPLFVNRAAGDFRLGSRSRCRGMGPATRVLALSSERAVASSAPASRLGVRFLRAGARIGTRVLFRRSRSVIPRAGAAAAGRSAFRQARAQTIHR